MDDYDFIMDSLIEEYNDLISRKRKGKDVGNELYTCCNVLQTSMVKY